MTTFIRDEVTVRSFAEAATRINQMLAPLRTPDLSASEWQAVIELLQEMEAGYFASSAGPDGTPWAENRPRTVQKKGHGIILRETWEMMESLVGFNESSIREIGQGTLEYGTSREWSWVHQNGSDDGKIPQREFLGMNDSASDDLAELVANAAIRMMFEN